ncbi:MAG TPA: PKD domain-containing protein [Tepidisphaeraceae bacterium]|jgi:PKD repeat protein|nr:PKD domain-containing protein [Tepidisphaeraceae bacterium]
MPYTYRPPHASKIGIPSPLPSATYQALTQTSLTSVDPGPIDFSGPVTQAAFVTTEPKGMAIHTVHFNGLTSTLKSGDALDAGYSWDYGDAGSAYNVTAGWIGAHTYQKPGDYTATLTVTDKAGNTSSLTTRITIAADTRRKIYVDSQTGSDSNSGLTPDSAIASFARASELMGDHTELLFHNGQSFAVADGMSVNGKNVVIGSYGKGTTARLVKGAASGWSIFRIGESSDGVVVQNLAFDSIGPVSTKGRTRPRALWISGTNFTVQNSVFLSLEDGVNAGGAPAGMLVQGNYFSTRIRAYGIWGEGYDHVYIGNTMTGGSREPLIRCSQTGVTRLVIEGNNLSRYAGNAGCVELRGASFFFVYGNTVTNGSLRFGPVGATDHAWTGWGAAVANETNVNFVNIRPGVRHLAIRDNVISYHGAGASNMEMQTYRPEGYEAERPGDDIRIADNTVTDDSADHKRLSLVGASHDGTEIGAVMSGREYPVMQRQPYL